MRSSRSFVLWLWTWSAVACGVFVLVVTLRRGVSGTDLIGFLQVVPVPVFAVGIVVLGNLILVHQARNRIGYLLLVMGFGLLVIAIVTLVTSTAPESSSILTIGGLVLENWAGVSLIEYPMVLILFLFPDGRFFTRRQAWAGRIGWIMVPISLLVPLFSAAIGHPFAGDGAWIIDNPIGFLPVGTLTIVLAVWSQGLAVLGAFGVWSLAYRYRRSSDLVKTQIRWVLFASALFVLGFITLISMGMDSILLAVLVMLAFASLPISITAAITRYRLFDIDRIISRTISYLIVVSLLAMVYSVGAVWLPSRLIGQQHPVFVAASTLAAAALFNPLRKRVLTRVDRRFNRSRYDGAQLIEHFVNLINAETEIADLINETTSVVAESMQPASIGFWVKQEHATIGT